MFRRPRRAPQGWRAGPSRDLALADRAPPEVLDRVFPDIAADLEMFRNEWGLRELGEEARDDVASSLLSQVEKAVRELKAGAGRK